MKALKNKSIPIAICLLLVLSASACSNSLKRLDTSRQISLELDTGEGYKAYDFELLPQSAASITKEYSFRYVFGLQDAGKLEAPALVIGPTAYPYELHLNGRLLHSYGFKDDPDRTRMFSSTLVRIDPKFLQETNTIIVRAWVSVERNPLMEIAITDNRDASRYVYWRNFFMTQLVTGGFTIGALLFIYFMFMYVAGKGRNRQFLWFALFCGTFSLAYINITFNHLAASDTLLTKLSRTGFFLSVSFFSFYVMETTRLLHKFKRAKQIWLLLVAVASGAIWSRSGFNATNAMFHVTMQFIITPNLLFCIVLIAVSIIKNGLRNSAILMIGFLGVIVTSLFDMRYETGHLFPYAWTLVYGYLWLVICIFFELALRQEILFRTSSQQATELNKQNSILQNVFQMLEQESDTLASSAEDIAVATRQVSITGNEQAAAVRQMVSTMEDAAVLLNEISLGSKNVTEATTATLDKANSGAEDVRLALKKLEAVTARIAESINLINEFNDQLSTITDIVKFIEGIATQIRIIAFNASLEAVAAGDAGRNFRIVADEVKRLADSTMSSVKNIRTKVGDLISSSEKVVSVSRDGYTSLEQSWDIAAHMGESFSGIVEAASLSAQATEKINQSISEENQAFKQIVQALKEISSGVNSFVESANYTSETTKKLHDIAGQLHNLIARYSHSERAGSADETGQG